LEEDNKALGKDADGLDEDVADLEDEGNGLEVYWSSLDE
jgi:hypothetical protein